MYNVFVFLLVRSCFLKTLIQCNVSNVTSLLGQSLLIELDRRTLVGLEMFQPRAGHRPQRWIDTIPSFDQLLATIEKPLSPMVARPKTNAKPSNPMVASLKNHRDQWLIDQKPLEKLLIPMVASKPFIQWQW